MSATDGSAREPEAAMPTGETGGLAAHIAGHCPHCRLHWRLRATHVGRQVKCRNCGVTFAAIDESSSATGPGVPGDIPGYEIEGELGHGGMGRVYRAREMATKRPVALKVMLEGRYADERQRRRFEREVELAAALEHPGIARIYASGLHAGHHWFAMEYVAGQRLDEYVAREQLGIRDILALFERICTAVNHAHQRGILHRDLKPGNILVDERAQPHVLDFGLAKVVDRFTIGAAGAPHGPEAVEESISLAGEIAGTPAYMSPEQTKGNPALLDVRSDVYALGVMLYRLLTGRSPYGTTAEGSFTALLRAIAETEPEPPRRIRKAIPDEVDAIVLKALEKDAERRYQTAGELGRDVEAYLAGDVVTAKRGSGWYALRKLGSRYKGVAAAVGIVVALSLGLGITMSALFAKTVTEYRDVVRQVEVIREREAARQDTAGDERALREMAQEYLDAWRVTNPTPLERWQDLLADDFVWACARGAPLRGKSTAIDWYRNKRPAEIAQFRPGTAFMNHAVDSARPLGDGGVVFAKVTFGGRLRDDSKDVRQEMWETLVFRRDPTGWRMVHEVSTLPQDVPATGQSAETRPAPGQTGPIAAWSFDHNDARDDTGHGHDGVLHGDPRWVDGVKGKSLWLDGVDDFVEVAHHPELDLGTHDFTISLWARFDSLGREQVLIEKWIQRGPNERSRGWSLTTPDERIVLCASGVPRTGWSGAPLSGVTTQQWNFIAVTRRGQQFTVYRDGQPVDVQDARLELDCAAPLKIGHRGGVGDTPGSTERQGFFLHGAIDEIKIFNRALSAEEIRGLAALGLAEKHATPAADNKAFTLTFRTAEPAPKDFDAWSFCWSVPVADLDAQLSLSIPGPDGKFRDIDLWPAQQSALVPGQYMSSDHGRDTVFFNESIALKLAVATGRVRFFPGTKFYFEFYRKDGNGEINRAHPIARIDAVVEPKGALEFLDENDPALLSARQIGWPPPEPQGAGQSVVLDFNQGVGADVEVRPGTFAADTAGGRIKFKKGTSQKGVHQAFVNPRHVLEGDFEVTVDFELFQFPQPPNFNNQLQLHVLCPGTMHLIARQKGRLGVPGIHEGLMDGYTVWNDRDKVTAAEPNSGDARGQMRITRSGDIWCFWCRNQSAARFTLLDSRPGPTDSARVELLLQNNETGDPLEAAFDNLVFRAERIGSLPK